MFADYFVVRRRLYKLGDLYRTDSSTIYWFWHGVNWRAFAAWGMGVWMTLPGFAQRVADPKVVLQGWSYMYYFSWPLGTLWAFGTYWVLCKASPMEGVGCVYEEDVYGVSDGARVVD
jgi:NCS1 family nucleobase:cation symporter-1